MENNQNNTMDWFDKLSAFIKGLTKFEEDDSTFLLGFKLLLRFILIIIMIILSPVLLVGLTIAFLAVL